MKAHANWLDRFIEPFAPRAALKRALARGALQETRSYDGAAVGRRTEGWRTSGTSADSEIGASLPRLRDRQRDLERNNPHARKAKSVWVNTLVGWGVAPRPASGDEAVDAKARALWAEFVKTADADGQLDFHGLMELAVGTMVSGGEALLRRHIVRGAGRVPLQLEVMEGDHLDHHKTGTIRGGRVAVQGVEFQGRTRTNYWLFPQHPGNTFGTQLSHKSEPYPANDIIHLYRKERTQTRGVPWGHSAVRELRDLQDYDIAEIVRKKTEACVVGIVLGADDETQMSLAPTLTRSDGSTIEQFEPGLLAYARGGKDVRFNQPSAMGGYADHKRVGLHTVAAGYLVPYELLTGDLSMVNFSSARVGLVEFRRLATSIYWLCLVPMMLNRVWQWFCEAAELAGELPTADIPVEWPDLEFESVNPIDDANAELLRMRMGTMTWDEVVSSRGRSPEDVMREWAARLKRFDEEGFVFDMDPRKVGRSGQSQAQAPWTEGETGTETERSQQAQEAARLGHLRQVK